MASVWNDLRHHPTSRHRPTEGEMPHPKFPSVTEDRLEVLRTNYIGFASLTALVWDHIDTFADEVEYIWKGRKGPFIYLFFFNRYFTPLGFVVNLHAYLSPVWTPEVCDRFIKYEGFTVALAIEVSGLMMLLRIRAIYANHPLITAILSTILAIETSVNIWLIFHESAVTHNPLSGAHACSMIFDHSKPYAVVLASASAWIPLLYDTIVFGLTLRRTIPPLRRAQASYIIERLLEDGILYYSVILSVTLVLTIMVVTAPEGIQNVAAQLEQLITVAMMSRITLNLRKAANQSLTQTFDSVTHEPKRAPWLLRLFPATRRAMGSLWEQSFAQFSFFDTSTSTRADPGNIRLEDIETRRDLSGCKRHSFGIQFATPEINDITQTTNIGDTARNLA